MELGFGWEKDWGVRLCFPKNLELQGPIFVSQALEVSAKFDSHLLLLVFAPRWFDITRGAPSHLCVPWEVCIAIRFGFHIKWLNSPLWLIGVELVSVQLGSSWAPPQTRNFMRRCEVRKQILSSCSLCIYFVLVDIELDSPYLSTCLASLAKTLFWYLRTSLLNFWFISNI